MDFRDENGYLALYDGSLGSACPGEKEFGTVFRCISIKFYAFIHITMYIYSFSSFLFFSPSAFHSINTISNLRLIFQTAWITLFYQSLLA